MGGIGSWWRRLRGRAEEEARGDPSSPAAAEGELEPEDEDAEILETAAIALEITDVLDLHSFPPHEVPDVVRDYVDAAYEKGHRRLRIIHGRGVGVQRRTVRTLLERDPRVADFGDAPAEAGGWGATWVTLE